MKINLIQNEDEYLEALSEIKKLMDSEPDTINGVILNILSIMVEDYENKIFGL